MAVRFLSDSESGDVNCSEPLNFLKSSEEGSFYWFEMQADHDLIVRLKEVFLIRIVK